MLWIKICGFCDTQSAVVAADLGVDAVGLNLVTRSKRFITHEVAREISEPLRGKVELVGVVENLSLEQAAALRDELRLDRIQCHGVPGSAGRLPEWAYLALGIANASDAERIQNTPGDRVLVDTAIVGISGGTGVAFDWSLVEEASRTRRIVVAGGLTPDNVAAAVRQVHPFGVDVASGVEVPGKPGYKDSELMRRFIVSAREASRNGI